MTDLARSSTRPRRPSSSVAARPLRASSSTRRSRGSRRSTRRSTRSSTSSSMKRRKQAAGELPDGPFRGVPFLFKDLGAVLAGHADAHRHAGAQGRRLPGSDRLVSGGAFAGRRPGRRRQDERPGARNPADDRAQGLRRHPQPMEPRTHAPAAPRGGSAAAVAAGMVPFAHADDGGGSIRIPASVNGLVGLKPTRQRITEGPLVGDVMSGLTARSRLSRSVRDTAALLDAVHGAAPGDPYVAPPPARPYIDELGVDEPLAHRLSRTSRRSRTSRATRSASRRCASALDLIESLGHEVEDLGRSTPVRLGAEPRGQLPHPLGIGPGVGPRPVLGDHRPPDSTAADVEPLTWALAELGRSVRARPSTSAPSLCTRTFRGRSPPGTKAASTCSLTPTMAEPPAAAGHLRRLWRRSSRAFRRAIPAGAFTAIFNATGQPAISLPLHWNEDGLPVGVQLVAPFGREDLLIRIAAQIEQAAPWADKTPPVFAAGDT